MFIGVRTWVSYYGIRFWVLARKPRFELSAARTPARLLLDNQTQMFV